MSSAKGIIIVDPLEGRGLRYARTNETKNGVYMLFQIGTNVQRTQKTSTLASPSLKWTETSQCRFDINPETSPLLKVFVMQGGKRVPTCLARGELSLIDVFYQKETDRWINLSPVGQLNIELTFYELQPMLPAKKIIHAKRTSTSKASLPKSPSSSNGNDSTAMNAGQKLISSVDRVFEDDGKEARGRLRDLARKVKRRYKESVTSHYDGLHRRKTSADMLITELKKSPSEKKLPTLPSSVVVFEGSQSETTLPYPSSPTRLPLSKPRSPTRNQSFVPPTIELEDDSSQSSDSSNGTIFSRSRVDLSTLTLDAPLQSDDLDLSNVPFSASSIGSTKVSSEEQLQIMRKENAKKRQQDLKAQYVPLTPEMYALVDRLEKGLVTQEDFLVDGGVSMYNGDGTWKRGCLRDSIPAGPQPALPPKIPVGMEAEEFFVLNKKDYIDYFRTVKQVGGL